MRSKNDGWSSPRVVSTALTLLFVAGTLASSMSCALSAEAAQGAVDTVGSSSSASDAPVADPQTQADPSPGAAAPGLKEIIVTAQRRQQNIQSVPVAVTAISGASALAQGSISIPTLSNTVPNLTMTQAAFSTNTYIRGVGTVSGTPNGESSVATYVDGVYVPAVFSLTSWAFNNVEQIEVLKGPQGTLFGNNTTGGVIQITTPDPSPQPSGNAQIGYANYNTTSASAYVTGPVSKSLDGDLAVIYENQTKGWGYNPTYGVGTFLHKNYAARSKWLYALSDTTSIRLALDASTYLSDGTNIQFAPGSIDEPGNQAPYPGRFNYVGTPMTYDSKQHGISLTVDHEAAAVHFQSITSYRQVTGNAAIDGSFLATPQAMTIFNPNADYWTQEVHLYNENPGRINWLVGAFYYGNLVDLFPVVNTQYNVVGTQTIVTCSPSLNALTCDPGIWSASYGGQRIESGALFGQATAKLSDDTNLTLGLRYTDEVLKLTSGANVNAAGQIIGGPYAGSESDRPTTWRVAFDHHFSDDVMGYVSVNRGFKSGGYNLLNPGGTPFYPETLTAYEMGEKSEFLDRRIRLNAEAFYYDYKNLQVQVVNGGATFPTFTNAAAARNYGADIDLQFAATEHLLLFAALGLVDATFTDYRNAVGYTEAGTRFVIPNAAGLNLPNSPHVSGNVGANYLIPTAIGVFKTTANLSYHAHSFPTPDNSFIRPSYTLLNATVEWWDPSSHFGIQVWGRNLTDATYFNFMNESTQGWYQSEAEPRVFGVKLMTQF